MTDSKSFKLPSLLQLKLELDEFTSVEANNAYIGMTWWQLAFDAVHDEVCSAGHFPHAGNKACSPKRKPESFNQDGWDEGSISEIAMNLIQSRFIGEGQADVIYASSSDRHAYNLARKQSSQLLYRIQTRDREAGRVLTRIERIYSDRDQFFKGKLPAQDYFSLDSKEPIAQEDEIQKSLFNHLITWPIKEWQWDQPENQSPYGSTTLKNGTADLLNSVESFRKWTLYDALDDVLAHHQSMSLYTGVGVMGSSGNRESFEVMDIIQVNQGLGTQEIELAYLAADSIYKSWNSIEAEVWSLRSQVRSRDTNFILNGEEVSRQTFSNRLRKLAESTMEAIAPILYSYALSQTMDESDFTALVWEMLDENVSEENEQ
jgi:hypothetical protein